MINKLRLFCLVLALFISPIFVSSALAQEDADKDKAGKSYVMHYIVVLMLVSIGVGVVGMGTGREIEEQRKKEQQEMKEKEERIKKLEES